MKKIILSTVLLLQFSTFQVRAAEVVAGGAATMGIVGLVLSTAITFGEGVLKAELMEEAVDILAVGEIESISPELQKIIDETTENVEGAEELSTLELLDVLVEAELLSK